MPVDLSMIGIEGQKAAHEMMESSARTNYMGAQTQKMQQETDHQAKLDALAQQASQSFSDALHRRGGPQIDESDMGGQMQSLADPLMHAAKVFYEGGAIDTAKDLLDKASEIQKRESDMEQNELENKQKKLDNIIKWSDLAGRYLGGAKNESEWKAGIAFLRENTGIEPEMLDQIENMPFSEDVANFFAERALSVKDQATLDYQAAGFEHRQRVDAKRLENEATRIRLHEEQIANTERYRSRLLKSAGGKASTVGAPTGEERKAAETVLKAGVFKDVPISKDDPDFNSAVQYVAATAKQMVRDNKSMTMETAMRRAALQAQSQGIIKVQPMENVTKILGVPVMSREAPSKAKFNPNGQTKDTAVPMPKVKSALKKGAYYITPRGVAQWNGSAFEQSDEDE